MASTTPQPLDTSTPSKDSDIERRLELHQIKLQPKDQHLTQAKKVVDNLQKMNFLDTIALAMYYKLGSTILPINLYKHIKTREYYKYTK